MGVKTTLVGLSISTAGKAQAEIAGADLNGILALCELKCQEITNLLNYVVLDILTPGAGDSGNITTINTQITNLA